MEEPLGAAWRGQPDHVPTDGTLPQFVLQQPSTTRTVARLFPTILPELESVRGGLLCSIAEGPNAELLTNFFSNGKLFRPLLALVGAAAVGGAPAQAVVIAQAIELLHGASLIHDDIIDAADTRRGCPAVHSALSQDVALVLGDYLILRALGHLTKLDAEPSIIAEAVGLVTELVSRCCRGQIDELKASGTHIGEEEYVAIVRKKTGALFSVSLAGGGLIAGATAEQVALLQKLGDHLGVIFQIYDDMLDLSDLEEQLGKPVGNSVAMQRPHVASVYMSPEDSANGVALSRAELAVRVNENGVMQHIQALHLRHVTAAEETIDKLPSSEMTAGLRQLTRHFASWAGAPKKSNTPEEHKNADNDDCGQDG